jgi:hypothetical protein
MQQVIGKNLDLDRSWRGIQALDQAGIETTVSFITGFPEETPGDQEETVQWFHRVLLTNKAQAQIQTLSPLPGSDYHRTHSHELELSDLHSSMVQQALALPASERQWLDAYPDLFSAHYSFPLPHLSARTNQALCGFLRTAPKAYGMALLAAADLSGGLMPLFQRWWKQYGNTGHDGQVAQPLYYFTSDFRTQLADVLLSLAAEPDIQEGAGNVLRSLTLLYRDLSAELSRWPEVLARCADVPSEISMDTTLVPRCLSLTFDYDLDTVEDHLRNGKPLSSLPPSPGTLLVTEEFGTSRRLQQAGPLAAAILTHLGEGLAFGELLARLEKHPLAQRPPAPAQAVLAYAITVLLQDGTLAVQRDASPTFEA